MNSKQTGLPSNALSQKNQNKQADPCGITWKTPLSTWGLSENHENQLESRALPLGKSAVGLPD